MKAAPTSLSAAAAVFLLAPLATFCATAPQPPADPLNRTSPQSSVIAFLDTCKAKDYSHALHYLDLSKVPEDARAQEGAALARQLEQVLEHDPQFDVAALSNDPSAGHPDGTASDRTGPDREHVASFQIAGKEVALELERVQLRSGAMVWKFASGSVDLIPQLARASSESPLERHLPNALVDLKFLEAPAWVWLALLVLAGAVAGFSRILGRLLPVLLVPIANKIAPQAGDRTLRMLAPIELLIGVALFRAGVEWIKLPPTMYLYLTRILSFLSIGGLAWLFLGILDLIIARLRGYLTPTHARFSSSVLPLLSRVVKVGVLAFSVVAILGSWGYNTNTVVAGLGIGGVAVALAAQKTIENLFGGVAVVSDKPVFVGDFCKFGDSVGTVEDIGLRSTRIRTVDRTLVTIPNAQFSSMSLENFSRRDKMLFHPKLNLRRDTTPQQVRSVLDSIYKMLKEDQRIETGAIPVRFIGVGSYSLDIEVFAYILTGEGDVFLNIQQELLLKILDAVAAAGTALALPTQASVSYSTPGSA